MEKKFTNSFENSDYEILTDEGYQDFIAILETIPYEVYVLKTKHRELECADNHIVFLASGEEIFVKDLKIGQFVLVEEDENTNEFDEVLSVEKTERVEEMYDIQIKDVDKYKFYTNGILSHNTKFFECLAGIRQPDTGQVLVGEEQKPTRIGRVGVVQQNYPMFMHKTVIANMKAAARGHANKGERDDRINDVLTKFGLADRKKYYPAMLSGGQKQRAAIAQQILCANNFLLMDEPFSGLDINMIHEVSSLIQEVAHMHELNTIIIVSHDINSTVAISDTIWIMGRDRDANNNVIPGAKIKHKYNLMERGLAWRDDVESTPEFGKLINEIKGIFPKL
jgi:polar amino acid transport system ATP-binding protein/sulfate transport system ATP-binding protein